MSPISRLTERESDRLSFRRILETVINSVIGFLCVGLIGGLLYFVNDYSDIKRTQKDMRITTIPGLQDQINALRATLEIQKTASQNQIDMLHSALDSQKSALDAEKLAIGGMDEHLTRLDKGTQENWTNINNVGSQVADVKTKTEVLKSRVDHMEFFKQKDPSQ